MRNGQEFQPRRLPPGISPPGWPGLRWGATAPQLFFQGCGWLLLLLLPLGMYTDWLVAQARVIEAGAATSPLLRLWPLQVLYNVIISLPAKD